MERIFHRGLVLLLVLLLGPPPTARAQTGETAAQAQQAFEEARYADALALADAHLARSTPTPEVYLVKARALWYLDRIDEALATLGLGIEQTPEHAELRAVRAVMLSVGKQQHEAALRETEVLMQLDPENNDYLFFHASFNFRRQDFEAAIEDYTTILRRDPGRTDARDALMMRGDMKRRLGQYDEALEDLHAAIRLDPLSPIPYDFLGNYYDAREQYTHSIEAYERAIALRLQDSDEKAIAYNNRGYARWKLGHTAEGLKDINTAIDMWPENAYAYRNRALVLFSTDATEQACADLSNALALGFTAQYGGEVETLQAEKCVP